MKRSDIKNEISICLNENWTYDELNRVADLFEKLLIEREIELLESVNEDVKELYTEYIPEYIKNRISILKHGI